MTADYADTADKAIFESRTPKRETIRPPPFSPDHDHDHDHGYMVPDMVPALSQR